MKCRGCCSVYGCKNKVANKNLSFFKLPKDPKVCETWLHLIDRPELLNKPDFKYSSYRVCSAHFEDSDFSVVRLLKPGSIPTKFLPEKVDPLALKTERASDVECVESKQTEDSSVELETCTSKKINKTSLEIQTNLEKRLDNKEGEAEETLEDHSQDISCNIIPKQTQNSICCCKKPLNCEISTQTPHNFINSLPHIKKLREQLHRSLIKQRMIEKKYKELQSILANNAKSDKPIRLTSTKRRKLLRPVAVTDSKFSGEDNQEHVSSFIAELESIKEKNENSDNHIPFTPSKKRKFLNPVTVTDSESSDEDNQEDIESDSLSDEGPSTNTIELKPKQGTTEKDKTKNENSEFEDYFNKWQKELLSKKKK